MSVNRSVSQSWNVKGHHFPKFPPSKNKSMCKSARVQVHLDQRQRCGEDEDQDDFNWFLSPYLTSLQLSPFHFFYCSFSLSPLFLNEDLLVWQRNDYLHVVEREESRLTTQHAFIPVFINLIGQIDDVTLVEAQFTFVLRLKVIERFTAWLLSC